MPTRHRQIAPFIAALATAVATNARAAVSVDERLGALERIVAALRQERGATPGEHCHRILTDARREAVDDPHLAVLLFRIVVEQCPTESGRPVVWLDAARAAVGHGDASEAARSFAAAAALAGRATELAPSLESLAALVAAGEDLPAAVMAELPVDRYVDLVGFHGRLDEAGYETLYLLGRALARSRQAAETVGAKLLAAIPDDARPARRALYLRGVMHLKRGEVAAARLLFERAAHLPVAGLDDPAAAAREVRVRELSWLAVGRMAFEAGDAEVGTYAYQQVVVQSPSFATAFLELGWLAMETGREELALLAFEPLIHLDPQGDVGRRAALLKGYVMLQRKEYDRARIHYEAVGQRYKTALSRFDQAVAGIDDLANLAHDCAVRDRAIADPVFEPLMARLEVEGARRLDQIVDRAARQARAAAELLAALDDVVAGRRSANPLVALAQVQRRAVEAMQEVQSLNLAHNRVALRAAWSAGPAAAEPCCRERGERLTKLRAQLETLLLHLESEQQRLRESMVRLRLELEGNATRQRAEYAAMVPKVQEEQRALLRQAVAATRQELHHTAMEGDAGVLESIWRFKEDHRQQIGQLEIRRKNRLAELADQFDGAVLEIEDDLPLPDR